MADSGGQEKTEDASEKKLKDVREKGQLAKSMELNSLAILSAGTLTLLGMKSYLGNKLNIFSRNIFSDLNINTFSVQYAINFLRETMLQYLLIIAPFLIILALVSLLVNVAQSGFNFSMKSAAPKLEKLNVLSNIKKLFFSSRSIVETGKSLIKLALISYLTYQLLFNLIIKSSFLPEASLVYFTDFLSDSASSVAWKLILCFSIIAFSDLVYQRQKYKKDIMMTRQEVKEESKDSEGNPQIKSAIRKLQLTMARSRMMQAVPKADVVITNPTHYAIALQYNLQKDRAPRVLAKGVDEVAQRIKQVAVKNNIPLYEDRELARSLYKYCDPGEYIPENLFRAVAKILAFVFSQRKNNKKSIV